MPAVEQRHSEAGAITEDQLSVFAARPSEHPRWQPHRPAAQFHRTGCIIFSASKHSSIALVQLRRRRTRSAPATRRLPVLQHAGRATAARCRAAHAPPRPPPAPPPSAGSTAAASAPATVAGAGSPSGTEQAYTQLLCRQPVPRATRTHACEPSPRAPFGVRLQIDYECIVHWLMHAAVAFHSTGAKSSCCQTYQQWTRVYRGCGR